MNQRHDDHSQFISGDDSSTKKLFYEVPTTPEYPYQDRIPSGLDPMGEIHLRGRAARGLAGGRSPWWVLISSWLFFGSLALFTLLITIASGELSFLPVLVIIAIFFVILGRGTVAKLSIKKRKNNRRI